MRSRNPAHKIAPVITFLSLAILSFIMTGSASSADDKTIALAKQGSFFVAGRVVQGKGAYDPAKDTGNTNEGNTFWVDQMYVQYQIPAEPRTYPLVLVHGGGGTGRVWETTPDGREGYQTLFLRRGFAVYIVDFPRRGRAGLSQLQRAVRASGRRGYRAEQDQSRRRAVRVVALAAGAQVSGRVSRCSSSP